MEKIINNNPSGYAEFRNFTGEYLNRYIIKADIFSIGLKLNHKLTGKAYSPFWKGFFWNPEDQITPCHFFNTINLGKNPWKVYFETTLPRLGNVPKYFYNLGTKKLAAENCKEIIAISQCAYDLQLDYLKSNYPSYFEIIKTKMKVQLPPQKPLIESYEEKKLPNDKIIFTLVGADFFRKGGGEIIKVFEKIIPENRQIHLNIVSPLKYGDYATHTTIEDFNEAQSIIKKLSGNITFYKSLENNEVLKLFKSSHVGLLPTWAETFGYSVLEAQANGCPVITTDIRALPEINSNQVGWKIKVPKLQNGNAVINTKKEREQFSLLLQIELDKIIKEILAFPKLIEIKGKAALEQIKTNH